jgi:hypothetical protein
LLTPELQSLIAGKVAALRSEAGLAAILDGIGEGFYAVDGDWRIILFNAHAGVCGSSDGRRHALRPVFERHKNPKQWAARMKPAYSNEPSRRT